MVMRMNKLVLISNSTYQPEHDALLKSFLDQKFELFCVVGEDCELREEAMDELAIGDGENSIYITTTSHPSESAEEVIEFAKVFNTKSGGEVRVVHI